MDSNALGLGFQRKNHSFQGFIRKVINLRQNKKVSLFCNLDSSYYNLFRQKYFHYKYNSNC